MLLYLQMPGCIGVSEECMHCARISRELFDTAEEDTAQYRKLGYRYGQWINLIASMLNSRRPADLVPFLDVSEWLPVGWYSIAPSLEARGTWYGGARFFTNHSQNKIWRVTSRFANPMMNQHALP